MTSKSLAEKHEEHDIPSQIGRPFLDCISHLFLDHEMWQK